MVTRLSAGETAAVANDVLMPLVARGVIVRRPRVVGALDRLDADRRTVRRFQRLRARHGEGPLLLKLPARNVALILAAEDVRRALEGSPEPFATANLEKRAALSHFQPHGVLISHGTERAERRRFNEGVLEPGRPVHALGEEFRAKAAQEADELIAAARRSQGLTWGHFAPAWWRIVRRITLGDAARDDSEITDMLRRLRADANWAFLRPKRRGLRDAFLGRLRGYIEAAEPGSLAGVAASMPSSAREDQFAHWLFAFDAGGMAAFRALGLLDGQPSADRAFLRGAVLESVRLWPTTPAILRDTTAETEWRNGTLPRGSAVVIFAPFFHRDGERLPFADRFEPELWRDGGGDWTLVPFSQGPGECPGRDVVLFLTSVLLERLLSQGRFPPEQPLREPLPATLSPFRLRFGFDPSHRNYAFHRREEGQR